ncbi:MULTISPECIES: factor H binding protein domain-containing protein [Neisseria]|uniref:factor H binding protein domain-containing protein n=1 Tax=Neisseria TaxID=482 RepID=UPI00265A62CF|nr:MULTISPECIES: factor H binding protein domain-containing protein [Neisseria]
MHLPFKFRLGLAAIACIFALSACASGGRTLTTSEKLDQATKAIENADKEIADKEKQEEEKEATVSHMDNAGSPPANLIEGAREYTNAQIELKKAREAKVLTVRRQIKQLEDAVKLAEQRKAEAQPDADQADLDSKKAELEKKLGEQKAQLASSEQKLKEVETKVQRLEKFTKHLEKSSLQSVKPELSQRVWESKSREFKNLGSYEKKFETAALFKAHLISENQDKQDTAFTEEKVRDMDVYINGEKYEGKDGDEYAVKPLGLQSQTVEIYGQDKDQNYYSEKSWVYEQPYSVVAGYFTQTIQNGKKDEAGKFDIGLSDIQGLATEKAQLPTAGAFDYEGKAFGGSSAKLDSALEEHQGKFKYRIDFDKRKGSGSIEGLSEYGRIDLKEADIGILKVNNDESGYEMVSDETALEHGNPHPGYYSFYGVGKGEAASEHGGLKYYSLGIFGPEANEVAGVVGTSGDQNNFARDVGFGGQKK